MRRFFITILAVLFAVTLKAQTQETKSEEIEHAGVESEIDSTLFGRDIFSTLPAELVVNQSASVRKALSAQVERNSQKTVNGYRIRLYFDSGRGSREASASVIKRFNEMYPNVQAYRSYASPNFKVTVGNFRTRVEAEYLLRQLKSDFPDAFIVRERFKYPSIGRPDVASGKPEHPLYVK